MRMLGTMAPAARAVAWLAVALAAACSGSDGGGGSAGGLQLPDGGGDVPLFVSDTAGAAGADASGPDGAADVSGCPGAAWCPCSDNGACDSGLCIDGPAGKVCAELCVATCPTGWACRPVTAPSGDVTSLCVPRWGKLCDPCGAAGSCAALGLEGALCLDLGAAGGFCGAPCASDADCPSSHACKVAPGLGGGQSKQCVPRPVTGSDDAAAGCACSQAARAAGLQTACSVDVVGPGGVITGTCAGVRRCLAGGLGACEVPAETQEVCDGQDNDCDGKTDIGACDDGNPCTADACSPGSGGDGCSHAATSGSCDADGDACTEGDACQAGVCQPGAAKLCQDGNPCTIDGCDAKQGCNQTPDDGKPCDDENPCTIGDVCAGGQCAGGGAKTCSSGDACVDAKCKITTGKCEFADKPEGSPCDDGSLCTTGETCQAGSCKGLPAPCNDQNACTTDACTPQKGCTSTPTADGGPCEDGNACSKGGGCKAGVCVGGTPVTCNDGDPCTEDFCDSKTNTCKANPKAGCGGYCAKPADCPDDGNPCTTALCDVAAGAAVGSCGKGPASGPCDDGNPCTSADTCAGGACKGQGTDCDDNNPCTTDGCDPVTKACSHAPATAPCDDGNPCTGADACAAGSCKPGAPACTLGQPCKGAGDCKEGACQDGVCKAVSQCRPIGKASTGALGVIAISAAATIDTTTGSILAGGKTIVAAGAAGVELHDPGNGAPKLRVFHVESFTVALNTTVTVSGAYGLVIAAKAGVNISGTLDARGGAGTAGTTNAGGAGGSAGPGGFAGGQWVSGPGCAPGNGDGKGPGGSARGACGGGGGKGGEGKAGGGGGGGGGACGGSGGAGASHADVGEQGYGGDVATGGAQPIGFVGTSGGSGSACSGGGGGNSSPGSPYGDEVATLLWGGSGGAAGGFGGFGGFGGAAKGDDGSAAGGDPGFSGGSGGGGGGGGVVALCGGSEVYVSGKVDVSGGGGGGGGSSGSAGSGGKCSVLAKKPCGGGGGGGRSGGGGGGGGGAGGTLFVSAGKVVAASGTLAAGGGGLGFAGYAFGGGQGGPATAGGVTGGKGGDGGKGGVGGKGGLGRIRVEAGNAQLGSYVGKLSQGGLQ